MLQAAWPVWRFDFRRNEATHLLWCGANATTPRHIKFRHMRQLRAARYVEVFFETIFEQPTWYFIHALI